MLRYLKVNNFALIRSLEFHPEQQLNVITGETGAGKSILLGALGLVLGQRAETSALLNKDEKCIVEAAFDLSKLKLEELFASLELDYDPETIIRREITPQGKSRAFVNDTPVQLSTLKELGAQLIQIHTQNTGLLVTDRKEQLAIIDDYAAHDDLLKGYRQSWDHWMAAGQELSTLMQQQAESERERDYIQFQFDELDQFSPVEGEEDSLPEEINRLTYAGEIQSACQQASALLTEGDTNISDMLSGVKAQLKNAIRFLPTGDQLRVRLEQLTEEVRDISRDLQRSGEQAETNPEKLEECNARLARLQLLMRKHQAESSAALKEIREQLGIKLQDSASLTDRIETARDRVAQAFAQLKSSGLALHRSRKEAADKLTAATAAVLRELGMPNASLKAEWQLNEDQPAKHGLADIQLLFSANAGAPLQALEKSASGGELSRVNFCFKTLLAGRRQMPTLIYDEADTGVSGDVAASMGKMMRQLGGNHQVITITHLPQVAAAGHTHYFVYKAVQEAVTESRIKKLDGQERVHQLAVMLSDSNPGEAALANARELLSSSAGALL